MPEPIYDGNDSNRFSPTEIANKEKTASSHHKDGGPSLDKPELLSKEKGGAGKASDEASSATDKLGKGYTAQADQVKQAFKKPGKMVGDMLGSAKEHRRGILFGGIGAGFSGILIAGLFFVITNQLVSMESKIIYDEAKVERRVENKVAQKIIQKIINRVKNKNSKGEQSEDETAKAEGEGVTEGVDDFDITSPQIVQDLADAGLIVEKDSEGNFTGLKDASGADVTNDLATNDDLFNNLADNLQEWEAGQVSEFKSVLEAHANADFDGIPVGTPDDQVKSEVMDDIDDGTTVQPGELSTEDSDDEPPPADTSDAPAYTQGAEQGGIIGEAVGAVDQAANSGASGASALASGVGVLKGAFSNPIFIAGFLSTVCSVEQSVTKASQQRVPSITTLLIRHATTTISLADQLKAGKLSSGELNQVMTIFSSDSSVKPTKADPRPEASLPFSSSAAWTRDNGGTPNTNPSSASYTPDIESSALPTQNGGTQIVNNLNSILGKTGGAFSCKVLTSPFGFLAQTFAGIVQIAGDIESFGATQAVITASILIGQQAIQRIVLPDLVEYFTPVGVDGSEDAVQFTNNTDAGMNLSFNDYSRRLGAEPVTNSVANAQFAEASAQQIQQNSQSSLSNRLFAFSNPDSLISKLSLDLPLGMDQDASGLASFISNLPSELLHTFSSIFSSKLAFAQGDTTNPGVPYDVTQYTFTDSELNNWYDPISNEQYLFSDISVGGQSVRRIDALGNPNNYVDSPAGDPNNNDLLHCFVDSYSVLYENINSAQNNCGDIGIYDSAMQPYNNLPTNSTVVNIYCNALGNPSGCSSTVTPIVQANNDLERYRQYLMDLQVVQNYDSLSGTQ